MLNCHSLFKSAWNSTYRLIGGTLKIVKLPKIYVKILFSLKYYSYIMHKNTTRGDATYDIYCAVAETISVTCSEHSNWHEAFDSALLLFT